MLKYFISATGQIALATILLALIYAYAKNCEKTWVKRSFQGVSALGIVLALIMTYMKTNTSKVDTSLWNLRMFTLSVAFVLLFFVFSILKRTMKLKTVGTVGAVVCLCVYACLAIIYYGTPLFEIPHTIALSEDAIVSSAYLIKFLGLVFGVILTVLMGMTAYHGVLTQSKTYAYLAMTIVLVVNTCKYIGTSFGIIIAKRIIASNHTLFTISKYTSNYSKWFIYAAMLVTLVTQIVLLVQSFTEKEPYSNPAERRKIIAKWRVRRRWVVTSIVCLVLTVLTFTVITTYANREVELSPIEDAIVENGNVYVSLEQVNDGSLHRFGYTADDGTVIRFIVIQKPNSSSYGVGLDACDICGQTGYYEKDGQVVCNLCDVVMNINTIGFKGGCNPIVIDWSIENGYIVVPVESLLEHISEFK